MPPNRTTPKREGSSSGFPRPTFDPSDLSDAARREVVRSDGAMKRAARVFTNNELPVPSKYLYRALPEFDRLRAIARRGQGSSSSAGSSARAFAMTEPRDEDALPEYDPTAFGRALSELDFVPDNAVDAVVVTLRERSPVEAEELEVKRRQQEEVNAMLLDKAIAASLAEPLYIASSDEE